MKRDVERIAILLSGILIASCSYAVEKNGVMLWPFEVGSGYVSNISDNGKWATFKNADYEEVDALAKRVNLTTGQIEVLPIDPLQNIGQKCKVYDITDDGETLVGCFEDLPAYYKDGSWHHLPMPAGTRSFLGAVHCVTPDGEWMVGRIDKSMTLFRSVLWHNGEIVELGPLPDYDEMYERGIIDASDYADHKAKGESPNVAFFKISDDGKHILTGLDHNYPGWGCSYIIYHTETKTYDWIGDEECRGGKFVSSAQMSNNGKWVSCSVTSNVVYPDGSWDDYHEGVLYDVENKNFLRGKGRGGRIGNDGKCYGTSIRSSVASVPLDKILRGKYGIDFYAETGYDGLGWVVDISSDLRTIVCQPGPRTQAYSITFPVPFSEAAEDVNLLIDYSIEPREGSELSRMRRLTLKFDSSSRYDSNYKICLMDGEEVIDEAVRVNKNGNDYELIFRDKVLEAGREYELVIPEGTFSNASTSSRNEEIRIRYKGRADVAMSPVEILPKPESAVIELGVDNYVMLDFGTDIKVESTALAEIYEAGSEWPMARLVLATDGRRIAAYPGATLRLPKDKVYEVIFPAGIVTDLNGLNANEEIIVRYIGSFLPETPTVTNEQLFFDDFSSPNASLNHFLQYEGDHLVPVLSMQEWGFDADNTPWNFSVRDASDYNYCAASTSMYMTSGHSDNWLIIPQLHIDNEYDWLTFKSQSYLYEKTDRLKVYVWECNDQYGSIDKNIIDRIRKEGDLIYDKVQSPGSRVEELAGDWLENEISLAAYKGKYIYIAFVDENEDGSALFIDDVCVTYRGNYTLSGVVPRTLVAAEGVEVSGTVKVLGDAVYTLLRAEARVHGREGKVVLEQSDLSITRKEPYNFKIKEHLPVDRGLVSRVDLQVSLRDDKGNVESQTVTLDVRNLDREIKRNVFVEEGTGTWCGYCPLGFLALDFLNATYPGRISEVSIHNGDEYAYNAYDNFNRFGAYPKGRVDRMAEALDPMSQTSSGTFSFSSEEGNKTFYDIVSQRLELPAEAEVRILNFGHTEIDDVRADIEVSYALAGDDIHYNILAILTEYDLPAFQNNNLAGMSDPLLASWGAQGGVAYYMLPAVARNIYGTSFYGQGGLLPVSPEIGTAYSVRVRVPIPVSVVDRDKLKLVVALIDASNGEVVNSASSDFLSFVGVDEVKETVVEWKIKDGKVYYGDSPDVEVYTISGKRVVNNSLDGIYIVRHTDKTAKLIVK